MEEVIDHLERALIAAKQIGEDEDLVTVSRCELQVVYNYIEAQKESDYRNSIINWFASLDCIYNRDTEKEEVCLIKTIT